MPRHRARLFQLIEDAEPDGPRVAARQSTQRVLPSQRIKFGDGIGELPTAEPKGEAVARAAREPNRMSAGGKGGE